MMNTYLKHTIRSLRIFGLIAAVTANAGNPNSAGHYAQVNLVSDLPGVAQLQDPDLVNAWGISFGPATPFWLSDNGTGKSTLYAVTNDVSGNPVVMKQPLVVNIPGEGSVTGQLFNDTTNFHRDLFIFASEDGVISGWRPNLGTNAEVLAARSGAIYKGIAKAQLPGGPVLLAANFHEGTVDVYDSNAVFLTQYMDPAAPAGYAPFNVQSVAGMIFVTFAKQDADAEDDIGGTGHGLIDVLNPQTGVFHRFATGSDAGGKVRDLNSPWGLALAPDSFGRFGGDLLVGNFGSGQILAFDGDGHLDGVLKAEHGGPLKIDGLWALTFGNGGRGGNADTLYFSAGPDGESHGLFGSLTPITHP